jgi:transposase
MSLACTTLRSFELHDSSVRMSHSHELGLRGRCAQLVRQQFSGSRIAKELGLPERTAERWKQECKADESKFLQGPHYSKVGSTKFTARERKTCVSFMEHQEISAHDAAPVLSGSHHTGGKSISRKTIGRWCRKAGLHPYKPQPKPKLTAKHKRERFQFAKYHKRTEFSTWAFSDQFKVRCPLQYTVTTRWRKKRSDVKPIPTTKFPPTLNVHATITIIKTIPLVFFDAPMNSEKFIHVNEQLIPNLCETFEGHEFRYAHDRAPWFVSHKSQRYFQEETPSSVNVVSPPEFPPNSPDINLAERAMANVLKRLSKRVPTPKSKDDVKAALIEEWNKQTPHSLRSLYESLPKVLTQIRARKGGNSSG